MNGTDKITNATKRGLKAVPNSLTLCNSLCGFGAILYTLRVYERVPVDSSTAAIFAGSAWLPRQAAEHRVPAEQRLRRFRT